MAAPVPAQLPQADGKPADLTVAVADLEDFSKAKPIEIGKEYRFEFVDPLLAILNNSEENIWLREKAVKALHAIGEPARKCVPDMLRIVAEHEPDDPLGDLDRTLGNVINALSDPYELDLDKDTFYKAIHTLLDHEHMWARRAGMSLLRNMPREELPRIIDNMLYVIEDKDRSYTSYHNKQPVTMGLEILRGFGIEDPAGRTGKGILNALE